MNTIKIYHGSQEEITEFRQGVIYASRNYSHARGYADTYFDESYNQCEEAGRGFVYEAEINLSDVEWENDFEAFDAGGYTNPEEWVSAIVGNLESGYFFVKNSASLNWASIRKD